MTPTFWTALLFLITTANARRILPSDKEREKERYLRQLNVDYAIPDPPLSPEDHRVNSLPMLDELPTPFFAGHLPATPDGHKQLFYWLVVPEEENARMDPDTPLLIWLNGGPGCSSMEGFFLENGPLRFHLQDDDSQLWKIVPNPYSWHLAPAWVVYIDQPVGTGLSFTTRHDYCTNDTQINQDFHYFFEEFLLLHRQAFLKDDPNGGKPRSSRPIFFSGESHAGHYIPSMMDYILKQSDSRVHVSLQGAAIGNGWIDPYHQYSAAQAAYGLGLINLSQKAHFDVVEKECHRQLDEGNFGPDICNTLLDDIVQQSHGATATTLVSNYDGTKSYRRGQTIFPEGHELVDSYLGGDVLPPTHGVWNANPHDVLAALHATASLDANQIYDGCTDPPYDALLHQDGLGVVPQVVNLLENNIKLLIYNGIHDLICNHVGNEIALMLLPWSQAEQWSLAPRYSWQLQPDKPPVAYMQQYGPLMFLKILNAGHMVPKDQPEVSFEMIRRFLYGHSFDSSPQELERKAMLKATC